MIPEFLCGAVARVEFGRLSATASPSPGFGSPVLLPLSAVFEHALGGWARIGTPGLASLGTPIIGFAAMELFNAAASAGFAGAYGQSYPHSMTPAP